jgi:hypothetical protein
VLPSSMTDGGGEYVMKSARSTKGKMSSALRQLVETQIDTNFLGVHGPLVVQWFLWHWRGHGVKVELYFSEIGFLVAL